jgi:hypothetical protein
MPNAFDQFDAPVGNAFDQFDAPKQPESSPLGDVAKSAGTGLGKGLIDFAGLPGDAANLLTQGSKAAGDYIGGLFGQGPSPEPTGPILPTSGGIQSTIEKATGKFHEPETTAGKYAQSATEFMGNPASYFGPGGWLSKALMAGASGVGSEAAGQAAEGTGLEGPARLAGGLLGGPLAARAVKPQLGAAQQALADAGVRLTPGQMAGSVAKNIEDKATSLPITGHFIDKARGRSIEDFNRAVANQTLAPIGGRLDRGTAVGHDLVSEVHDKLSNAYDHIVPYLELRPDQQWFNDLRDVYERNAAILPETETRRFQNIIDQQFGRPAPLDGEKVKRIEQKLTQLAGQFSGSANADHQILGGALRDTVQAVRENMERMNPDLADQLRRINTGWAMYTRLETAAANRRGSGGVFTPGDLLTGVKRGDKSVRKGSFARGNALMQGFAEAGQNVLPSTVADSGTTGRALMSGLVGGAAAHYFNPKILAGLGAASVPFTRPAIAALNRYVRPTTGARASYANAGRGAGTLRPFLQGSPLENHDNPYAP